MKPVQEMDVENAEEEDEEDEEEDEEDAEESDEEDLLRMTNAVRITISLLKYSAWVVKSDLVLTSCVAFRARAKVMPRKR